jgi:uncharacterized protein (DUF1015 family)
MARIYPFQAYRYAPAAGPLDTLVTQPYDKISPAMRERYLALNPYNLVRIILGEARAEDSASDNVYTRAAALLEEWMKNGVLIRDRAPGFYIYSQEFTLPGTGERFTRRGFIGLGALEEYSAKVVHRHEQTLTGPKKDRMELLRHTRAHFGQIFMLYPDAEGKTEAILEDESAGAPAAEVVDEYGVRHRLWAAASPEVTGRLQAAMADKKLLIADGHHRYETALKFYQENGGVAGADRVMMTFVNMYSPGLKILATHRVVSGVEGFAAGAMLRAMGAREVGSLGEIAEMFRKPAPERVRIGVALAGARYWVIERVRKAGELDVRVLHEEILGGQLGISEEAVREERCLRYVRGLEEAAGLVEKGEAQAAFLLEPVTVEQVAEVAFSGGVMPQKSTDFYPKLLSGMTIYKLG